MKFIKGMKVKMAYRPDAFGLGKVICEHDNGTHIGVQFPKIGGHDLDGRVDSGGWWCMKEELVLASPLSLENK